MDHRSLRTKEERTRKDKCNTNEDPDTKRHGTVLMSLTVTPRVSSNLSQEARRKYRTMPRRVRCSTGTPAILPTRISLKSSKRSCQRVKDRRLTSDSQKTYRKNVGP